MQETYTGGRGFDQILLAENSAPPESLMERLVVPALGVSGHGFRSF